MDLVLRLQKEMKSRATYDKVFSKIWGASGKLWLPKSPRIIYAQHCKLTQLELLCDTVCVIALQMGKCKPAYLIIKCLCFFFPQVDGLWSPAHVALSTG